MDGYEIPEVARHTGKSPEEVRLALEEGRMRGAKVAGRWRVSPAELDGEEQSAMQQVRRRLDELERRVEHLEGSPRRPTSMRPALDPLFGRPPEPPRQV